MKIKQWSVSVLGNKEVSKEFDASFYTSDTDANLIIKLADNGLNPSSAIIALGKKTDDSLVDNDVEVKDNKISFPLFTKDQNILEHGGDWKFQIIFIENGKKYTSKEIHFSIGGWLMDGKIPNLEGSISYATESYVRSLIAGIEGGGGLTESEIKLIKVNNAKKADTVGSITSSQVTTALGFTPPKTDTKPDVDKAYVDGLVGDIKTRLIQVVGEEL